MGQFLLKTWSTILEIWTPSKESKLVAELTICLVIGIWSLQLWALILKLPIILLQISSMREVITPWLILAAVVLIQYLVNRIKNSSKDLPDLELDDKTIAFLKCIANIKQMKVKELPTPLVETLSANMNANYLSALFKCSLQEAQFHIDQLEAANCLEHDLYNKICDISPKGRSLLFKKGQLPK